MLETLDKSIGTILRELDELKLSNDTLVIFFSDNGHLGPKDSQPLRGSKADLYEGGIRVPMIVRWPGVVKPGATCDVPVISIDFFPTLLEAIGVRVTDPFHYPHYHGQSIAPSGVVRRGKYKLVEWFEKSIDGIDTPGAVELYDLEKDLNEQNNLAEKMPKKARKLHAKLKKWRKSVGAQEMVRNPAFKSEKE
jgi:arylsulfatase A-like enzyme